MSNVIQNLHELQVFGHMPELMHSSQHLRADVIFGSPKLECLGTGICKIVNYTNAKPIQLGKDCKRAPAFLSSNQDGSVLKILLFRELVCLNVYKNHLRSGVFDMPATCLVDADLAAELGLTSRTLVAGKYEIQEKGNCFHINIRVQ
jgi:hypothetical protein